MQSGSHLRWKIWLAQYQEVCVSGPKMNMLDLAKYWVDHRWKKKVFLRLSNVEEDEKEEEEDS